MSSEGLEPERSYSGEFLPPQLKTDIDDDSEGNNHFFYYPAPPCPAARTDHVCNFTKTDSERQPRADRVPGNRSAMEKWDLHTEEVFLTMCHDYHIQGQLLSTTFTETTWREIQAKLMLETHKHYDVQQLKSKFCNLRQEWKNLKEIVNSKTGDGFCWDPATRTLIAPNEFWDEWLAPKARERMRVLCLF